MYGYKSDMEQAVWTSSGKMPAKSGSQMDSCGLCLKYIMIVMNALFFLIGCAIAGVGLWILLDKNYMSALFGTTLMTATALMIIIGGCLVLVISFFGCCGAINMNKCMLLMYFISILIIFLILVTGGILCLVFRTQLGEEVLQIMRDILSKDYGVNLGNPYNRAVTYAWDTAQTELYCCAVDDRGWSIYLGSQWYDDQPGGDTDKPMVPPSCCQRDQYGEYRSLELCQTYKEGPPWMPSGENVALHMRGCYYEGRQFLMDYSAALIGMGFGIGLLMIMGMVFSLWLYRYVN